MNFIEQGKIITTMIRTCFISLLSLMLYACGGGGGGSSEPAPDPGSGGGGTPAPTTYTNPPTVSNSSLGSIYVNADNMTLYLFENDRDDTENSGEGGRYSNCNDSCATNWPPMLASSTATADKPFSLITRNDGSMQWAFRDMPMYMYAGDSSAGDVNGEGINGTWYVSRPDPLDIESHEQNAIGRIVTALYSQLSTDGNGGVGTTRIERDGYTLYTFENDRNDSDGDGTGDSDCNSTCAELWPPLFADPGATPFDDFTLISRDDGSKQWALNGLPIYFYVNDNQAGDINGDGLNNIWYIARSTAIEADSNSLGTILTSAVSVHPVDATGSQDTSSRARRDFSLYVFDNDVFDTDGDGMGDSDCNGGCATNWPPMYADPGAVAKGLFSIIDRDDGTKQWAFKDEPLYFFVGDSQAGDTLGEQLNNIWHLARLSPVQLFNDATYGQIFAARGMIEDVDGTGNPAGSFSNKTGYTLYTFDDDTNDTDGDGTDDSDCNGNCAVTWPPLYATQDDVSEGDFTIITRDDDSLQWAYKGKPLYFYVADLTPGDVNGVYGTWHEVTP